MFLDATNRLSQKGSSGACRRSGLPKKGDEGDFQANARILVKYYRLSLEDREEGESGSITNQRRLVEGYLQGHRDLSAMESRELSDDG